MQNLLSWLKLFKVHQSTLTDTLLGDFPFWKRMSRMFPLSHVVKSHPCTNTKNAVVSDPSLKKHHLLHQKSGLWRSAHMNINAVLYVQANVKHQDNRLLWSFMAVGRKERHYVSLPQSGRSTLSLMGSSDSPFSFPGQDAACPTDYSIEDGWCQPRVIQGTQKCPLHSKSPLHKGTTVQIPVPPPYYVITY